MMRKKLMQAHQQGAIFHAALKLPNTVPFIPGAESLVRRLHSKKFIVQHVTLACLQIYEDQCRKPWREISSPL